MELVSCQKNFFGVRGLKHVAAGRGSVLSKSGSCVEYIVNNSCVRFALWLKQKLHDQFVGFGGLPIPAL